VNGAAGINVGAGLAAGAAAGAAVAGAVAGVAAGGGSNSSGPTTSPNSALPSTPVPSVNSVIPIPPTLSAPSSSTLLSNIIPSPVATAVGAQVAQDVNSVLSRSSTSATPSTLVSSTRLSDIIP